MADKPVFTEKQYYGRDFNRISIRLVAALFCFTAYYFETERDRTGTLFLIVGIAILTASVCMLFIIHYKTTVQNGYVILKGIWTTRLVKIDLNSIILVERRPYSTYNVNSPVYNLHSKGKIRFYSGGKEAIVLTDRDGLQYVLGTQCPAELERAIKSEIAAHKNP